LYAEWLLAEERGKEIPDVGACHVALRKIGKAVRLHNSRIGIEGVLNFSEAALRFVMAGQSLVVYSFKVVSNLVDLGGVEETLDYAIATRFELVLEFCSV
jgi:hypothetical protein